MVWDEATERPQLTISDGRLRFDFYRFDVPEGHDADDFLCRP